MIANAITMPTNTLFGHTADTVWTRYAEQANRTDYKGPGHTTTNRQLMQLYRTFAKRNGEVLGSRKASVKFTTDMDVDNASGTGTVKLPCIVEYSVSIPEGATEASVKLILAQVWASHNIYADVLQKLFIGLEI